MHYGISARDGGKTRTSIKDLANNMMRSVSLPMPLMLLLIGAIALGCAQSLLITNQNFHQFFQCDSRWGDSFMNGTPGANKPPRAE